MASLAPLLHPAAENIDLDKTRGTQCLRGRCRTFVGPAHKNDRRLFKPCNLCQSTSKLADRNIARHRDVAERPRELVSSPHIDDRDRLTAVEPSLQIADLDP